MVVCEAVDEPLIFMLANDPPCTCVSSLLKNQVFSFFFFCMSGNRPKKSAASMMFDVFLMHPDVLL